MRVNVNGIGLEVQVSGEGPAVLLVHGYPDTHALWRHQVAALNAAGYRTIAPDLRGFGASDKPKDLAAYDLGEHVADLLNLLDHFEVERAHLVGHDWGASITQLVAATAPDRISSLSLLSVGHLSAGGPAAGIDQLAKFWYMLLFQFQDVAEQWLAHGDLTGLRMWAATHPDLEEVVTRMRDPEALTSGIAIYRRNVPPQAFIPGTLQAPPIKVPTMGVWSSGDVYLTEEAMVCSAPYIDAPWRYERLEDAGHWMQLDQPEKVNELLLDFIASLR
ncbi:pimeloyl-ACP methyl ester carboxylesterase [Thermocatellispora tengchongensis]|uniref:Pimeloyl-ACP methyl ester carboxylesterase n=1 Tax=Thermocatellispora tengchongensis TaxID=1073253 RepID=A0A840PBR5_9ACTN|nr:alpha/beta fold hydrolase [Thermocatellispora tengchongensis]MBB5136126.1 pimeloyl-ACP methyl ester carboxylesterase [Thermocatellispora tengchongensis]